MKYKKKPVAIEAFQFDGDLKGSDGKYYVPEWAVKAFEEGILYFDALTPDTPPIELFIKTLEGTMHAPVGSYVIQGVLSMELMNEVLNAYAKADFRFAHALNVFQGLIDKAPTVEERKHGHWEDIDLDTSVCSVCKKPQEYETKYCPECGAKMENNGDDDDE